jgi:hypothetical protein
MCYQFILYKTNFHCVFGFSKKDPDVLPKVVANLSMLLQDSSVQVQKRVIQAASQASDERLLCLRNTFLCRYEV